MEEKFKKIRELIIINPLIKATKIDFNEMRIILEKVEKVLTELDIKKKTARRCYYTAIEILQNSFRHGKQGEEINFVLNIVTNKLFILCENLIHTDEMIRIKEKLEEINSYTSREDIKKYYQSILRNGRLGMGGSGIGFIDIRRKTDNEILYYFESIDSNLTHYSIIATIDEVFQV